MNSVAKTIVATGLSSGLGIEVLKQLLQQTQPYRIIFGARNTEAATNALQALEFDRAANPVTILPLDLADLKGVKSFAQTTLDKLGQTKIDYLFLNAGITNPATQPSTTGSQWCDSLVVNHISHHYLVHLLREKLEASKSRIVVVSSGAVRGVTDPSTLDADLKAGSTTDGQTTYSATKFAQLLGAHWWRRELSGVCDVVAVSPGLIPGTGLGRGSGFTMPPDMPDAKPLDEGASNLIRAFTKSDFPDDPDRIFLTSWGEWWETSVIEKSLDKKLQDKWSFSKDTIEKDAGIQ